MMHSQGYFEFDGFAEFNPYQVARDTWAYLMTDDDAYRDVCDREDYIDQRLQNACPQTIASERRYLIGLALDSFIDLESIK